MKPAHAMVASFIVVLVSVEASAERNWQTGTWAQVGIKRTLFVADVVHERMPPGFDKPQRTEVATYVIETDDRRYELQSMVAIAADNFDLLVTVGNPVMFAIERKTAYIMLDGNEHRLLVLKNERKKSR